MYYKKKIYISRQNMNRLYHGTKRIWEVLRESGAMLVTKEGRVALSADPASDVIGIDFVEQKLRFLTDWQHEFIISNVKARDKFEVKALRVNKLPLIVVETPEMKEARVNCERAKQSK